MSAEVQSGPRGLGAFEFRRSSFCAAAECVEVSVRQEVVLVRDSKSPEAHLAFSHAEWQAFLAGAAVGEFNLP